jgi:hypothetical protein
MPPPPTSPMQQPGESDDFGARSGCCRGKRGAVVGLDARATCCHSRLHISTVIHRGPMHKA